MKAFNRIDIKWQGLFRPIGGLQTDIPNRICIEREIIPIIFVPGIMGSRLRRRSDKITIWDPDDIKFMVKKFGWLSVTAAERKDLVVGSEFSSDHAEVISCDQQHNKKFANEHDIRREKRGWGGVMWGSYGRLLIKLQEHRWPSPLDACFEFPVHAFGYNWIASNGEAGLALKRYIDKTISDYQAGNNSPDGRTRDCNKVILVTHSMGGLVARSACMMHEAEEQVLGVIHGVQPAVGSPAAYWRMKAGFERPRGGPKREFWDWLRNPLKMAKHQLVGHISAAILGTDGEEVTSLLGNSPGGLELLPTKDYRDNAGNRDWLRYPAATGEVRLPVSDPYEEIYLLRDVAYRMVDPRWLDPEMNTLQIDKDRPESGASWSRYRCHLNTAKDFHDQLQLKVHSESYQFYGTDLDSPDRIRFTRDAYSHSSSHTGKHFRNKGSFCAFVDGQDKPFVSGEDAQGIITLEPPDGKGDGTVPVSSGSKLSLEEKRTTEIGTAEGSWFAIGHQDIYGTQRAQQILFNCICKLAQKHINDSLGRS
jgi:hypothetical protein